jgi:hypothetical protein
MIVVLCPTYGQPAAAAEMLHSFRETTHLLSTEIVLVVDRSDATLSDYLALVPRFTEAASWSPLRPPDPPGLMVLDHDERACLSMAFNAAAPRVWDDDCIIGMVGNDHRFLTPGWDERVTAALERPGVAYGDDGIFGEKLATAGFISSVIPRTLGWLALPASRHYGIDDAWTDIGRDIGALHYLPDVKISHESVRSKRVRHRIDMDRAYWRAQAGRKTDADAYYAWRDGGQRVADVARVLTVIGAGVVSA